MFKILQIVLYVSCTLSICGTSAVFLSHLRNHELWKRPARRLLVWLCIADFLSAVVYLFPSQNNKFCIAQSFLGIYFPVAGFLWTDCIALYVYLIISSLTRRSYLLRNYRALFGGFHLVSWLVPLICALAVLSTDHAGKSQETETKGWCWVRASEDDDESHDFEVFIWEIVGGKFIEWFSIFFWCPILYFNCWVHLSKHEKNSEIYGANRQRQRHVSVNSSFSIDEDNQPINFTDFKRKLFYVPIIFFVLRLPGSCRTVFLYISPGSSNSTFGYILSIAQTFCDPLQGFCNGILFVVCNSKSSENGRFGRKLPPNRYDEPSIESWNTSPMLDEEDYVEEAQFDDSKHDTVGESGTSCEGESWSEGRASGAYRTRLDEHSIIE